MFKNVWGSLGAASFAAAIQLSALTAAADPGNQPWTSSSGETGAGLGMAAPQAGRFWGEAAFHTQEGLTAFSPLLGAGFFIQPDLELEVMLPIAYASVDIAGDRESGLRLGAPYAGINYVRAQNNLRFKVGGGLAWNPVEVDTIESAVGLIAAEAMRGRWDWWLWTAERVNLVAPFRLEYDISDVAVFGGDAGFDIAIPHGDDEGGGDEVIVILQLAPGIGFRLDPVILGARLSSVFFLAGAGDEDDQFALEPYVRVLAGSGYFLARFTFNLDEPYGSSFQEDEIWGLHLGGGLAW